MIKDVKEALDTRFDKRNLCCNVPQVFEHLKGKDSNFEMNSSNTMQNLQLQYRHNIVAKKRAVIFVSSELVREGLEKLTYRDAFANADLYKELLEKVFKFTDVEVVANPTKAEMIEKLAELEAEGKAFNKNHEPRSAYCFVVIHVGFKLEWTDPKMDAILDEFEVEVIEAKDGTKYD